MHRWLFPLLTAVLFLCFVSQSGYSSKPETPKRNIDMSITFLSEPDTGKECTVTFSFTPMEEIDHKSGLDDEAKISFYPKDALEVISGDSVWSGKLAKGKTETIQLVFKPVRPAYFQVDGVIRSGRVDPKSAYRHRVVTAKLVKAYERAFGYHNIISKHFLIGEPPVMETEYWVVDAQTGEAVKKKARVDSPFLPPPVSVDEKGPGEVRSAQREPGMKRFGFPISGNKTWLEKENAYHVGTIRLRMGEQAAVFLFESQRINAVKADFELIGDCCTMKKLQDNWIALTSEKDHSSCKVIGVYNQVRYLINISVGDSSLEKVSSDSAPNR